MCYGVLTPLNGCLVGLLEIFGFYEIFLGTTFDPLLAYFAFRQSLQVGWELMYPAMEYHFGHSD